MELSTAAALISAVIALISLVLSILANKQQKASDANIMYNKLISDYMFDKDIYRFVNMVEYDKFNYDADFHNDNSEIEKMADKSLMFFNQVCCLMRKGSLPIEHMGSFNYQICRLLQNNNVKDYLYNIHHWSKNEHKDCPFAELIDFAKKHNLLDEQFDDKNLWQRNDKYHKNLNF